MSEFLSFIHQSSALSFLITSAQCFCRTLDPTTQQLRLPLPVNDGVINVQRTTAADRELHELFMRKDDKEEVKKKCEFFA